MSCPGALMALSKGMAYGDCRRAPAGTASWQTSGLMMAQPMQAGYIVGSRNVCQECRL